MGERIVLALLSLVVGLLIGLLAPGVIPGAQDIAPAERAWLNPTRPTPESTVAVTLPRAAVQQTAVPPTLTPPRASTPGRPPEPAPEPGVTPEPTSTTRTFVIPLAGGGEMKVVANDEAAARNNVKSAGATPAN